VALLEERDRPKFVLIDERPRRPDEQARGRDPMDAPREAIRDANVLFTRDLDWPELVAQLRKRGPTVE
jgi:hypothetical protein